MSSVGGRAPAGPAGDRHISSSVTWNLVNLVRRHGGDAAIERVLELAQSRHTAAELEGNGGWFSFDEGRRLFEAAVTVMEEPHALRRVGAAIARQDMTSEVVELLRSLGSPAELLRHIDQVVPKFCTVVDMEAESLSSDHAVLSARSLPGFPRFPSLCDFTVGLLEQVPLPFDLPPAAVVEEQCEAKGADRCVFHVSWADHVRPEDPERRLAALEAETAVLAARFESFQETAADLVAVADVESVLAGIISRASLAVRAPRHVLVVWPAPDGPMTIHHAGCTPAELDLLVEEIIGEEPDEHDGARLIVDIASVRRHYGRLAAVYDDGHRFFPGERGILQGYSRLAAAALDTATALAASRQQAATAQALLDLARQLAQLSSPTDMARKVAVSVPVVTDADAAVVTLWNEDERRLEVASMHGLPDEVVDFVAGVTLSPDNSPGLATMLLAPDTTSADVATAEPVIAHVLEALGMRHAYSAPIVVNDGLIGAVTALFRTDVVDDRNLLSRLAGLADLAATAIQNSRLLENIRHQALYDAVTGLPNKRLLLTRLEAAYASFDRTGEGFGLFFVDLDRFKNVNDTLGHSAGDDLLRQVGERFHATMREEDTVVRLGGDEFAILMPRVTGAEVAATLAERLHSSLQRPFVLSEQPVFVTASIGIALAPADGTDAETLLKHGDTAMYQSKEQGGNRYAFYLANLQSDLTERLRLDSDLHLALGRGELYLEYQPQYRLADGALVGVEALVRWEHPELGRMRPDQFIPLAEESGLIVDIDAWVIEQACRQARAWARHGLHLQMSVNLADRDLRDHSLVGRVAAALDENQLAPGMLELEVTERVVDAGSDRLLAVLRDLKSLGVNLAIDDFGTGNSGLLRLRTFPIDTLKIDKSFVQEVSTVGDRAPLLSAMVSVAHELGLTVVAEGVETAAQVGFLIERGCDYVQGYLFSAPVREQELVRLAMRARSNGTA